MMQLLLTYTPPIPHSHPQPPIINTVPQYHFRTPIVKLQMYSPLDLFFPTFSCSTSWLDRDDSASLSASRRSTKAMWRLTAASYSARCAASISLSLESASSRQVCWAVWSDSTSCARVQGTRQGTGRDGQGRHSLGGQGAAGAAGTGPHIYMGRYRSWDRADSHDRVRWVAQRPRACWGDEQRPSERLGVGEAGSSRGNGDGVSTGRRGANLSPFRAHVFELSLAVGLEEPAWRRDLAEVPQGAIEQ